MNLPREAVWACQAEFSAAFKRATAAGLKAADKPYAETLLMATLEERAAAALWQQLGEQGIRHPGCYLPTRANTVLSSETARQQTAD